MKIFSTVGRIFYGSAIAATGLQQFFFKEFFQILFPPLPYRVPGLLYFAYLVGILLVIAGSAIALNIKTKFFAYILGCLFLFFFIFCYVPYELFISPYNPIHLGLWINALKEFAYAGGAFAIAGNAPEYANDIKGKSKLIGFLEKNSSVWPHYVFDYDDQFWSISFLLYRYCPKYGSGLDFVPPFLDLFCRDSPDRIGNRHYSKIQNQINRKPAGYHDLFMAYPFAHPRCHCKSRLK